MRTIVPASRSFRLTAAQLGRIVSAAWVIAIFIVVVRAMVAPRQNTVFTVFHDAGQAWLSGGSLYLQVGKYLYSPLAAAFFSLFAWMPVSTGGVLWRLVIVGIYLLTFIRCMRHFGKDLIGILSVGTLLLLP